MKVTANGKIIAADGDNIKMVIHNKAGLLKNCRVFRDKDIKLTIERKYRKRSNSQNAAYWGYVVPMVRSGLINNGYKVTIAQTHDFLKAKFLVEELINEDTGEVLQTIGSTSGLSTSGFMDYIAEIQQWGAEFLSIDIPNPGEQSSLQI